MERVKSRRRRPPSRGTRFSLGAPFRLIVSHVAAHPKLYGPALSPVLLFLLAHVVVLPIIVLLKMKGASASHTLFGTVLAWAVLGFLPFLGLSYLSYFMAAKPLAHLVQDKLPDWSAARVEALSATAYAAGLFVGMFLLIRPASVAGDLILLGCCVTAGLLHWSFYRRFAGPADPPAEV